MSVLPRLTMRTMRIAPVAALVQALPAHRQEHTRRRPRSNATRRREVPRPASAHPGDAVHDQARGRARNGQGRKRAKADTMNNNNARGNAPAAETTTAHANLARMARSQYGHLDVTVWATPRTVIRAAHTLLAPHVRHDRATTTGTPRMVARDLESAQRRLRAIRPSERRSHRLTRTNTSCTRNASARRSCRTWCDSPAGAAAP